MVAVALILAGCQKAEVDLTKGDVALAQAVQARFDSDPSVKSATSRVRVQANQGTVTLSGSTDTAADKSLAEQIAHDTQGVSRVINEIIVSGVVAVEPDEPFDEQAVRALAAANGEVIGSATEDARIYHEIRAKIVSYEATPKKSIFVSVQKGDVTLRGVVFTTLARDKAVAAAREVNGVIAVQDLITINSPAP